VSFLVTDWRRQILGLALSFLMLAACGPSGRFEPRGPIAVRGGGTITDAEAFSPPSREAFLILHVEFPTPCYGLRTRVRGPDQEFLLRVDSDATRLRQESCPARATEVVREVNLGRLPEGEYVRVLVNEEQVDVLDLRHSG
jgi:hypothetical protein